MDELDPTTVLVHCITLLLIYAYVKEQLTFPFIVVLTPSLFLIAIHFYQFIQHNSSLKRAKYIVSALLLFLFTLTVSKAIKNEGGMSGGFDDHKWLVRHRRSFEMLFLSAMCYSLLTFIDPGRPPSKSLFHEILLNIFSSLSMPLTVCSGGACNSIYISTITSILSALSVPMTLAVPILNILGYMLQIVGAFSLYSANKWRSYPFWIYMGGMVSQLVVPAVVGAVLMILAVVLNAKYNKFTFGRRIFKQSVI